MTREEAIGYLLGEYVVVHEGNEYEKELNEALDVAIKALQGDMYCPNCGVRLVPENEYLEPTQTHGRLIDAGALLEAVGRIGLTCDGGVDINDLEGTIQEMAGADRPHGEWYNRDSDGTWATVDFAYCSECKQPIIHKHASPLWHFCPNCGADMRKETK